MISDTYIERLQARSMQARIVTLEAENARLRAELAEAKERTHYAEGVANLAMQHRDKAEAELAEAEKVVKAIVDVGLGSYPRAKEWLGKRGN